MFGGDVRRWKEAAARARQATLAHLGDPLYESYVEDTLGSDEGWLK